MRVFFSAFIYCRNLDRPLYFYINERMDTFITEKSKYQHMSMKAANEAIDEVSPDPESEMEDLKEN